MLATSGRSRLARGLLPGAAMELFFSLDNLVALAVAVELWASVF